MSNGIIQVDPRVGSRELLRFFTTGRAKEAEFLPDADFQFMGNGPDGVCMIGIERKTVPEFLSDYNRFAANQLVPLLNGYKFTYLIIEGAFKTTADRHVLTWDNAKGWQERLHNNKLPRFSVFMGRVHTLSRKLNLCVYFTVNTHHTACTVEAIYDWFQRPWEEHESYNVEYTPAPPYVMPRMPTVMEKMLVQIPGVGWVLAIALAGMFHTMEELAAFPEDKLANVLFANKERPSARGRKVGPKAARVIKQYVGGK